MNRCHVAGDSELLREYLQQQDEQAFAELVRRHIAWVYHLALRQLRDPADAEDAAQAVFILLLRKAESFSGNQPLSPWLYKATMLICRDIRKQRQRRVHHENKAAQMQSIIASEENAYSGLACQLDQAISRLRVGDREAILLRFFQSLSHDEIALSKGISRDAAKMRLTRSVQKLRTILTSSANPVTAIAVENMLMKNPVAVPIDLSQRILTGGNQRAGLLATTASKYLIAAKIKIAATAIFIICCCGTVALVGVRRLRAPAYAKAVSKNQSIVMPIAPFFVYYIAGHVPRPGVYQSLGQPVSLHQAILAAGGLDQPPTANSFLEIFRRLPNHTEEKFIYRYQPFMREDPNMSGVFPLDRNITKDDTVNIGLNPKIFSAPIHGGDLLMVAVADLDQPQQRADLRLRVSSDGKVLLPQVGNVDLLGKTMPDAEQAIRAAYAKANVIPCALVSVARLEWKDN